MGVLNWMAILLKNRTFVINQGIASAAREYMLRTFLPPYGEYDVIRGYRADDSYFSFASAFLNNDFARKGDDARKTRGTGGAEERKGVQTDPVRAGDSGGKRDILPQKSREG